LTGIPAEILGYFGVGGFLGMLLELAHNNSRWSCF